MIMKVINKNLDTYKAMVVDNFYDVLQDITELGWAISDFYMLHSEEVICVEAIRYKLLEDDLYRIKNTCNLEIAIGDMIVDEGNKLVCTSAKEVLDNYKIVKDDLDE